MFYSGEVVMQYNITFTILQVYQSTERVLACHSMEFFSYILPYIVLTSVQEGLYGLHAIQVFIAWQINACSDPQIVCDCLVQNLRIDPWKVFSTIFSQSYLTRDLGILDTKIRTSAHLLQSSTRLLKA